MDTRMMLKKNGRSDIQSSFLANVKSRLPEHVSFPDELAELLKISRDSAYRRIREETIMSLDEVRILCDRYNVSVDSLMGREAGHVSFELSAQTGPGIQFKGWMESMLKHLQRLAACPGSEMTWHSKDLPIFHYFQFPRLAAFKLYWWMILSSGEDFGKQPFDEKLIGRDLIALGEKIWDTYSRISSTEIISRELINTTLRQIEYTCDGGYLTREQAEALCQDCTDLVRRLQRQTQQGFKGGEDSTEQGGRSNVYLNELLIGDNTLLFQAGNKLTTYITHNNFNIISTGNESFCAQTAQFMKFLIQKSVLISRVAEKERVKFFNRIYKQIEEVKMEVAGGK